MDGWDGYGWMCCRGGLAAALVHTYIVFPGWAVSFFPIASKLAPTPPPNPTPTMNRPNRQQQVYSQMIKKFGGGKKK